MWIAEEYLKRDAREKEVKDEALIIYKKQLRNIHNIKNTDWYIEIKDYWIREKEWAEDLLKLCSPESLKEVQIKYQTANNFVTFLNNIENSK